MLHAVAMGPIPWHPGLNEAACCAHRTHPAPAEACGCGLYGFVAPRAEWRAPDRFSDSLMVPGAIVAWGERFFLHPTGFRAQYAKPVLLSVCADWHPQQRQAVIDVARQYDCEVVDLDLLVPAAREYAQLVPQELLPPRHR
jgi:hypothetical protein